MYQFAFSSALNSAIRAARPIILTGAAIFLASCSISTPLGPIFGDKDDVTGSIPVKDHRFTSTMTDEDWRRAQIAAEAALNPTRGGRAALWSNPDSGRQGSVSAVSDLVADGSRTCRSFVATMRRGIDSSWFQGRACQSGAGGWQVVSSAPWTPPAAQPLPGGVADIY